MQLNQWAIRMSAIKRKCGFSGTAPILVVETSGRLAPRVEYRPVNGVSKPYITVGLDWIGGYD